MDASMNSHLIAQVIQDRIEEATTARGVRAAKTAQRPQHIRLLRRSIASRRDSVAVRPAA
jgi:hypothetical protein